ncbi:MAG: hypothetical protein ACODAF_06405 [Actinomycetota bacterium]
MLYEYVGQYSAIAIKGVVLRRGEPRELSGRVAERAARHSAVVVHRGEPRPEQRAPEPPESAGPQRPPVSGAGSGVRAWREYAAAVTGTPVKSWQHMSREQVMVSLDAEGV